MIISNIFRIF